MNSTTAERRDAIGGRSSGWHQDDQRSDSCVKKNVLRVKFPHPISVDITVFRQTVESSLMADRREMEGGWSWQKLYITSNPNLLSEDFTNPRNWYNSAAQKNILNDVTLSQVADHNNNNSHSHFPRESPPKGNATKLPRINTQERKHGSKSADIKISNKSIEHNKLFLKRGPSFDEATNRLHKAAVCSLYEAVFPPPLGKSISWPRGSRGEEKRRAIRLSKRLADSNQEDSRISLPPLNPDSGHPFLPHIPLHQPWVSSGQDKIKNKVSTLSDQRHNTHKRLQVSSEKGKDQSYKNKIEKWFKEIKSSDSANDSGPCVENEQLHNNTPCPPVDGFSPHPPGALHPSWKSHCGTRRLKNTPSIPVPDFKDPVQFSPVFSELRIHRKEKPDEKTEINRDEYKLKQKSSLRLKMADSAKSRSDEKGAESLARCQKGFLSKQNGALATQPSSKIGPKLERKSKLDVSKDKKVISTKADRHTGMKFLLARASEESDTDEVIVDGENLLDERDEWINNNDNNNNTEIVNSAVSTEDGLLETKASVVNIVLYTERPPERKPRHIALSLKKMEEKEHQSGDGIQNCTEASRDSRGDKAEMFEITKPADVRSDPEEITPILQPGENGISDLSEGKHSSQQALGQVSNLQTTGGHDCQELSGHLESESVDKCERVQRANEINPNPGEDNGGKSTTQEKGNNENKNMTTAVQGTCTFTFAYKTERSALSKYNILQPFRDQSQPNIVLPSGGQPVSKPSCNEWTHPPTYKMDLRNYDNLTAEAEKRGFHMDEKVSTWIEETHRMEESSLLLRRAE